MSVQKGEFRCPICENEVINDYDWWEKKGDKWIFHHSSKYDGSDWASQYGYHNGPADINDPKECWKKYGGSTANDWNESYKNEWTCNNCKETRKSFLEFLAKKKK